MCWFLLLYILHISTIIGDMLKASATKTFPLHHHSLPILLFSFFPCFLLSLLFLCFPFFSYSYLFYPSLFIIYSLSLFFFLPFLSSFLLFLFPLFLIFSPSLFFFIVASSFSNFLLLATPIFVFVNSTILHYSPLFV